MNAFMGGSTILLFLFGTSIGSFLNVLGMRYTPGKRIFDFKIIGGRSACPRCGKKLHWYELVPIVSFIIQGGRCRGCKNLISLEYPIVEVASGLVFAFLPQAIVKAYQVVFYRLGGAWPDWYYWLIAIYLLAALTLILLSIIDFRLKIIPDQANILIASLGILLVLVSSFYGLFSSQLNSFLGHYSQLFGFMENIWLNKFAGVIFGLVFFGVLIYLSRGRGMGMGDLKLALALGLLLGWPDIILSVVLAFISGAFWSIILIILGRKKFKSTVPFGPFIALGALVTIFFGRDIMDLYFSIF